MPNLKNDFSIRYLGEALDDIEYYLSNKQRIFTIVRRVKQNPLPNNEGGYGKPLGNRNNTNLTGCLKIKLKHPPIRIVYKLYREKKEMLVIAVSDREDSEVYELSSRRLSKHNL